MCSGSDPRESQPGLVRDLLDLALFVPIGLAANLRQARPELSRQGRDQVEGHLRQARAVGEMAATELRRRCRTLSEVRSSGGQPAPPAGTHPARPEARGGDEVVGPPTARPGRGVAGPAAGGDPGDLPIPGYDSLSASQVVQRMPGLAPHELRSVRDYEASHRSRKTVILKATQLLEEG